MNSITKKHDLSITRRRFLKVLGAGAGLAATGGLLEACASATVAPTTAPTAVPTTAPAAAATATAPAATAPKANGKISIYSALNQATNDAFFAAFKAAVPGIEVELLPLAAAGALQTRIVTEKDSPKGDIFVGGDRAFHAGLAKQGLLEKYVSPNAAAIPAAYKDPDGFWTGWYVGIFAFVHNTSRLSEVGGKKPAAWDDLLDPAWKGKIVMPSPITTGGGFIIPGHAGVPFWQR